MDDIFCDFFLSSFWVGSIRRLVDESSINVYSLYA